MCSLCVLQRVFCKKQSGDHFERRDSDVDYEHSDSTTSYHIMCIPISIRADFMCQQCPSPAL